MRFAQGHCGLDPTRAREILCEVADAVADIGAGMLAEAKQREGFAPIAREMRRIWDQGVKRSLVQEA